ncbi:hypothetical protein N9D69_01750 [Flavobacteriales bacterium]|nr:hypothetical protein [Flavobacteriales bacterium]
MNIYVKNALAVVLGWLAGSTINMGLVQSGHSLFPIEGIDPKDMEALATIMPSLDFNFFIFPFLGHALGTLVGAWVAAKIAGINKMIYSLLIGSLFIIGGVMVNYMITGPLWFTIVDLSLAYIPMAWLGGKLATKD